MKTVAFYTLGCKLNFSETSTLGRQFEAKGYKKVPFEAGADIYLINTCSVTDNADKKCKKIVREALRHNPEAFIAVVGCFAQLKPNEVAAINGVDVVLGANEKFKLLDLVDTFEKKKHPVVMHSPIAETVDFYCSYSVSDRTRTFLKIQDGCDYNCSFCTIPLARGKSRSDSIQNIVRQAYELGKEGVKEIVLTGVNIGDFGIQQGTRTENFFQLITQLDEVDTVERFRISSIEPNLLSDDIIRFVSMSKRFVPHFHIPLQSGSNEILKLMRRRYRKEWYAGRVQEIKKYMPNACIGVDVITGHPGETEALFMETFAFLDALDISYLHVFTYSERANTYAIQLPHTVPMHVREQRTRVLRDLSEKKKMIFYKSQLGTVQQVLFEAEISEGCIFGYTPNYIKVSAPYDPAWVNEIKEVVLYKVGSSGCVEIQEPLYVPALPHHAY